MSKKKLLSLCLAAGLSGSALAADALNPTEVPLTRLKLYTSGDGYFEHSGKVRDNMALTMNFTVAQMNDLLKTLVVRDFDGGSVDDISYPTLNPLKDTLGAFSVNVAGNLSRYDLLERLRGARVRFTPVTGEAFTAAVLGVERKECESRHPVEYVSVLRDNGEISAVDLASLSSFAPDDPKLVKELGQALAALADARGDNRKAFTMHFNGKGERRVAFGYVLEMPVWKPTYRLSVDNAGKEAFLQGWALVENLTDSDWKGLELSLVAGKPMQTLEPLYKPYKPKYRPGIRNYNSANDSLDDEDIETDEVVEMQSAKAVEGPGRIVALGGNKMDNFAAPSSAHVAQTRRQGEFFSYDIAHPVNLARRQAAMLEIMAQKIPAEKVLVYDAWSMEKHPANALFVENKSGNVLPEGTVTVYDEGYGGDTKLRHLPEGGETLVRYGMALGVDAEQRASSGENEEYSFVKFSRGVLQVRRVVHRKKQFMFRNPGEKAFTLLLCSPQNYQWRLADNLKAWKTLDGNDILRVEIPAGKDTEFTLAHNKTVLDEVRLLDGDHRPYVAMLIRNGALSEAQKAAWQKAEAIAARAEALRKQLGDDEQAVKEMTENQERTRKNLNTLADKDNPLYKEMLARLAEEIKQTAARQQECRQRKDELRKAEKELADYVQGLEL